jgi:glutaredoxin 3
MSKVEIYSKGWCGYCSRAKRLLQEKGVDFTEHEVSNDPERLQEMLDRSGGRMTVPQIFINEKHVGGSDELAAANRSGQLDEWLAGA